jgi:hypothetical protein
MGSFLSSLSSNPPPDDFDLMEMEPLSRSLGPRIGQLNSDLDYSGRRYPLNPNGGGTTNLLQGFRHRLRTSATQIHLQSHQEWDLEISGPNLPGARTSDGSHEVSITQGVRFT